MATTYTYSLSNPSHFNGAINQTRFTEEVDSEGSIVPNLIWIKQSGDDVDIKFNSALSTGEQTTLDGLVSSHNSDPDPKIRIDTVGSNNTTTIIRSNQTGNRTMTVPDVDDTFAGISASQTLTNKKLVTSNTDIVDNVDNTKKICFNLGTASTATCLTFRGAQTGNRTIDFPDADIIVVGDTVSQTLSNKNLVDSSVDIVDNVDSTKKISFSVGGASASTSTTILCNQTGNRTYTLPDATTTAVGIDVSQTLTNKTFDADLNTITNIDNADIKAGAAIDATKIADGTVTNAEFQYINTLTSNAQTQLDGKASSSHVHAAGDVTTGTFADSRIAASNVTQHEAALTIVNANISAGVDAIKIADGTVTNAEFQYINTLTSNAQTQLDAKSATGHTHVAANVTDFDTAADARITAQKGNANGLATLDGGGKVPASQLSLSNVDYQGSWNASTNTPTITASVGTQGHYYVVGTAGSTNIDGITDWKVGDWIIFNGTVWEKNDNTDQVTSVAGKQGAVTLDTADIASGTFADARISQSSVTQHEASLTIVNANISAGVDSIKIADGTVTNAEFQYINTLTSNAQTQLNGKASSSHIHAAGDVTTGTFADARIAASNVTQHEAALTIVNANISAGVDAIKIADGTVTNAEFQYINTLTSNAQTQLNAKAASSHTHAAADVTSGTFADARIASSNVTQHEALLTLANQIGAPTGTVVGTTDTQTLTNKTVYDNTFTVAHNAGPSQKISFDVGGASSTTTTTLAAIQTANRTLTFPDATDTLVGKATTDTLTNKTATSTTNNITAKGLHSSTTTVSVSAATAPTTGQVLTATSGTAATWQTPGGGSLPTTTKGDVIVHNGSTDIRLGVGTNGQILGADSAEASGVKWINGDLSVMLQIRRTTTYTTTTSYVDLTFDVTDVETDDTILKHDDTNTDRITLISAGTYKIEFNFNADADESSGAMSMRMRVNDTTVLNGSFTSVGVKTATIPVCKSFIYEASANDYISLQALHVGSSVNIDDLTINVVKIDGVQGAAGAAGAAGADGDITWQGDWVSGNYVVNQAVSYNGSSYVCHTNTVSNEVPTNTSYWDVLASKGDAGGGEANTVSNIGTGGVGIYKQKTGVDFELKKLNSTSATSGIVIVDDTGNNEVDVNLSINSLTADATPDGAADYVLTYDASASSHKKVLIDNLPGGGGSLTSTVLSAATPTSTTSSTYATMDSMTTTPASGTYLVTFSSSGSGTSNGGAYECAIFKGGTIIQHTNRWVNVGAGTAASDYDCGIHSQDVITVNGSEVIDIRFRVSNGTFNINERSLILLKIA